MGAVASPTRGTRWTDVAARMAMLGAPGAEAATCKARSSGASIDSAGANGASHLALGVAECLALRAREDDTRLPAVENLVIVSRPLVARDRDLVGRAIRVLRHRG